MRRGGERGVKSSDEPSDAASLADNSDLEDEVVGDEEGGSEGGDMAGGGEGRGRPRHGARPVWSRNWRGSVRERRESRESRQSSEAGCGWREDSSVSMCREDSGVTVDSTLPMSREHSTLAWSREDSGLTVASSTGYMFGESGELNYMSAQSGELNAVHARRRLSHAPVACVAE